MDAKDPSSFQKAKLTRFSVYDISVGGLRVVLGGTTSVFDLMQLHELSIGFFNDLFDIDVVEFLNSTSGKLRTLSLQGIRDDSCIKFLNRNGSTELGKKSAAQLLEDSQDPERFPSFMQNSQNLQEI